MKQDTLGGYLEGNLELPQKALLTAWDCLSRYQGDMVLVGGLAIRHITRPPGEGMPGPVTLDVDFGIGIGASSGLYDSIKVTLSRHGFAWEGGRFKRGFDDFELHIDLLTDNGKSQGGTVMVDDGLQVSLTPGINRALECHRVLEIEGINLVGARQKHAIRVSEIGPLLVLKLNAFAGRKAPKDAHDFLYLGMNYLEGTERALELFRAERAADNPGMERALETLRTQFGEAEANGPLSCAAFRLNNRQLDPRYREEARRIQEPCVTLARELLRD